jgi:hypothetical protein
MTTSEYTAEIEAPLRAEIARLKAELNQEKAEHDLATSFHALAVKERDHERTLHTLTKLTLETAQENNTRLKAREAEMKKALRDVCDGNDLAVERGQDLSSWPESDFRRRARALLAREHAEDRGPVIDAVCRKCDWYDNYDSESCEHHDRSCIAHSLFSAPKPAEEWGPEVGE